MKINEHIHKSANGITGRPFISEFKIKLINSIKYWVIDKYKSLFYFKEDLEKLDDLEIE